MSKKSVLGGMICGAVIAGIGMAIRDILTSEIVCMECDECAACDECDECDGCDKCCCDDVDMDEEVSERKSSDESVKKDAVDNVDEQAAENMDAEDGAKEETGKDADESDVSADA